MKKLLFASTGLALGASLFAAAPASAAHEGQLRRVFTADLAALNAPGDGQIRIEVFNQTKALVTITAQGVTPDGAPHAQHIHMPNDGAATCPTVAANDDDGDGFVSVVEGAPAYGGVVTSFTTEGDTSAESGLAVDRFPVGENGAYEYERVIDLDPDVAANLANGAVVLHGADLDDSGEYDGEKKSSLDDSLPFEATVPTACGALQMNEIIIPEPYAGTTGIDGLVTRYYASLLNRAPDTDGFEYWKETVQNNDTGAVISAFAQSDEFVSRYGQVVQGDVGAFVDFTYTATLGRTADAEGKAYWVDQINAGNTGREAMIALFAESDEFKSLTGTA